MAESWKMKASNALNSIVHFLVRKDRNTSSNLARDLLSNGSLFVGHLYAGKTRDKLRTCDFIFFFSIDLQTVKFNLKKTTSKLSNSPALTLYQVSFSKQ